MSERHFFDDVYRVLVHLGIDPHTFHPNYEEDGGTAVLAIPDTRTALAIEGDNPEPLRKAGWHVSNVRTSDIQSLSSVYRSLSTMAFEHIRRAATDQMTKSGSKEEETLLHAILNANLPVPDRNFVVRRDNGKELTVPDFTWEEYKLCFYVDGNWWHVTLDDRKMLDHINQAYEDSDKNNALMESNRTRSERDADNRSELQSRGWHILSCSDRDLHTEEGVQKQVDRISRTMRSVSETRNALIGIQPTTDYSSKEESSQETEYNILDDL